MSTSRNYGKLDAADDGARDDVDSDEDDLVLRELDPFAESNSYSVRGRLSKEERRKYQDQHELYPLKTLQAGSEGNEELSRTMSRVSRYSDRDSHEGDGGGHGDKRTSQGEYEFGDEAPLLQSGGARGRRKQHDGALDPSKLASKLRLPGFMSSKPLSASSKLPDGSGGAGDGPSEARTIAVGQAQKTRFPPNIVSNAKYTPWSFLPRTLYNEFKYFLNMYFLLIALSQVIPVLRIGYLSTYIVPLAFVLSITLGKEALDDIARRRRDAEANAEPYTILDFQGPYSSLYHDAKDSRSSTEAVERTVHEKLVKSRDLKVGHVLKIGKDQRLPADVVILKSIAAENAVPKPAVHPEMHEAAPQDTEASPAYHNTSPHEKEENGKGDTFIRTDQLDGETDWKLRLACPLTQSLPLSAFTRLQIVAGKPNRNVNEFIGNIELEPDIGADSGNGRPKSAPLTIDSTAWANTVLASSSTAYAVVIYTGSETRSALSTSPSRSKTGLLECEINNLTKILCILTVSLSIILVILNDVENDQKRPWYVAIMLYNILFSTIIPISLRVNLDMGKSVYSWFIEHDKDIEGTVVRTSTIPEDLGRIEYLLTDKTGTLTQNEMELKKIHVGTVSYANDAMDEVASYVRQAFSIPVADGSHQHTLITPATSSSGPALAGTTTRTRREIGSRVRDIVLALALCHNVTPTTEEENGHQRVSYQASSPDEIAIVKWTESVGLRLVQRDRQVMVLESTDSDRIVVRVRILDIFPFTSEGKRMGIIVQFFQGSDEEFSSDQGEIWFYQKGADTVMSNIVAANDWLEEETANMAREGLRTLVIGRKKLSNQQYAEFASAYKESSLSMHERDADMAQVVKTHLERDLELLGVTGVEDRLQRDVKPSLELLRNAGINIWMLTGDKVETARCVAISAKLVARGQYIHTIAKLKRKDAAQDSLDFLASKLDACLLIDGDSLSLMLSEFRERFIALAVRLPTVVACRCSPTQKADLASLIRSHTRKRICCIGDGGNDVSMIQAADVGVGIVGKEGRQASLAADFSITQFCHLTKLLVWHGRNSYKRSAKLAQFVMHRGIIISVMQAFFSISMSFEPVALFIDWLLVGYATVYTMVPVFSLVLDKDVDESLANLYPELYKELKTGRSLSYKSFATWVLISLYQGGMIQGLSQVLVHPSSGKRMVGVSYTTLILNELIMVAFEIMTWHPLMIAAIVGTGALYFGSIPFLGRYFDLGFVVSVGFVWRVVAIGAIALVPPYVIKITRRTLKPPSYRKVRV